MSKSTTNTIIPKLTDKEFADATTAGESIANQIKYVIGGLTGMDCILSVGNDMPKERVKSAVFASSAAFINCSKDITVTIICESKEEAKTAITEVRDYLGRFHDIDDVLVRIDKEPLLLVDTHNVNPILLRAYYDVKSEVVPTDIVISRLPAERTREIVGPRPLVLTIVYDPKTKK